jgi:hypothetical protein
MRLGRAGSPTAFFAAAQLNQISNRNATAKIALSLQRDKKKPRHRSDVWRQTVVGDAILCR